MSNFGAPGQFDDAELERQIQDEYRRRQLQQAGHSAAFSTLARARQPDYTTASTSQHLSMLGGTDPASPYYARPPAAPHHSAPYTRVTNPYAGLAEARAAYQTRPANPADQGPLAQLYAAQQRRQQQAVQQVVASNYAAAYGTPASSAYGAPAATTYAPSPAQSSLEQQRYAAAYGLPTTTTTAPSSSYAHREALHSTADLQAQSSGYARPTVPPTSSYSQPKTPRSASSHTKPSPPSTSKPPPTTPSSTPTAEATPSSTNAAEAAASPTSASPTPTNVTSSTKTPTARSSSKNKDSSSSNASAAKNNREPPLPPRVATKDGKVIVGGKTTYYTGWLPLGLDDDKYWLSELQVYLRANFAEAFGATEEDIAAPMHGRNKPIALGQVGIRCKHCKRKCV